MEDAFPAESEYPAVTDAVEEEEEEEEEEEAVAEAPPPVVVAAAAKKRGRPAGSKNRAPDVYTALLDRMTQLEETLTRRPPPPPQSSTGGTPEDPPPAVTTKPKRQARPRRVAVEAPPATSQVDLLMDQITQAREARRQQQLNFYATFLP
jgi:hypothetical protein